MPGAGEFLTGSEQQQDKIRPQRAPDGKHMRTSNVTKINPSTRHHQDNSWWSKADNMVESRDPSNLSRSLRELLPSPYGRRKQSVSDDFLYSFDHKESPGKPLSLEAFVKTNTKATEKFVEKEYEILDGNGETVKGRKALKSLHRGMPAPPVEEAELIEDDGFELV